MPIQTKVPAVLKLHKKGPFKAGDEFEVSVSAVQLFKGRRFQRIDNAESFVLHRVVMNSEGVGHLNFAPKRLEYEVPMFALTGPAAEVLWPTTMHPERIVFHVEATTDVAEFSCEVEGVTVRSKGDAEAHDYDKHPLDVTVGA